MGLLTGMEKGNRHSIQGQMCRKITSPFFGTLGVIDCSYLEVRKATVMMRIINLGPWVFYIEESLSLTSIRRESGFIFSRIKKEWQDFAKLQWSRELS